MIATLLKFNGGPIRDDLFKRFIETTKGVVASYQLETPGDPTGNAVFTVWQDEAARDAYLASSQVKPEVDKAYPNQARTTFQVRNSKT